jgi:DNA-binding winged helix-turn-helix (wHTH) protein
MAAIDAQGSRAAGAAGADVRKHSLQLQVLGPLEALLDGVALTLGGCKERTALALLAAHVGTVVATDDLIDGIWGDEPTTAARSTLHTYISNLRSRVGDVIVHDGGGYRLEIEPDDLDAFVFEHAVSNARELATTDQAQAAQTLRQAASVHSSSSARRRVSPRMSCHVSGRRSDPPASTPAMLSRVVRLAMSSGTGCAIVRSVASRVPLTLWACHCSHEISEVPFLFFEEGWVAGVDPERRHQRVLVRERVPADSGEVEDKALW